MALSSSEAYFEGHSGPTIRCTTDVQGRALTNGLPKVEVAYLTIVASTRTIYAATHGRGIWQLTP
jgi:hypothetical protein